MKNIKRNLRLIIILSFLYYLPGNLFAQCNFVFNPDSANSGTTINFTSSVTGYTSPISYLWDFGDSTTSTLQNPSHVYAFSVCGIKKYTVSLTITDGASSTGYHQKQLTVNNTIFPELQDIDPFTPFSNCDNNPSNSNPNFQIILNNITADSSFVATYTVNWGDGSSSNTYTNSSFPITHLYSQLGLFNITITATDSNNCQTTNNYNIANQGNPAIGLSSLGNTQGCAPQTFKFVLSQYQYNSPGTYYVWDFGDGSPNVTWQYNDPFVNDTISHTYFISSCTQSNSTYSVQVTAYNNCDFTTATVGNIRIYSSPQADFAVSPDTGCVNSPICFTNNTISGFGYNCNTLASYSWNFDDAASGANNTSTAQNPCHNFSAPGIYNVTLSATNGICGNTSISKQVVINETPVAIATPSTTNGCVPLTVNFNNSSTGGNLKYNWSVSPTTGWSFVSPYTFDSTNTSIIFNIKGNYNVTLTSLNNCGSDDTTFVINATDIPIVTLAPIPNSCNSFTYTPNPTYINSGSPITTYNWSFPGGNPSISNVQNPSNIFYSIPGTYIVTVIISNFCGSDTSSQTFTIHPLPNITTTANPQNICFGDSSIIFASGASIYNWSPATALNSTTGAIIKTGTLTNTLYTVIGTDTNGCSNSDSISIIVNPLPVLSISPASSDICVGDSVSLTISGASTYSWGPSAGLNSTTSSTVVASPTTTTTYNVVGTDANGCSNSETVIVTVNPLPNIIANPISSSICFGDSATFNVTGANNYTWSPAVGLSSTIGSTVTASPLITTTYTIIGVDNNGCINTSNVSLIVNPLPIVSISSTSTSICQGDMVTLTATGANTYSWSPSVGLSSTTGSTITAMPGVTTTYFVIGTDANGCSNTDSITIVVNQLPIITVNPAQPSICTGDSVLIIASGAASYTWGPASGLSSTIGASVTAFPLITSTYTIYGTGSNGCVNTLNFVVNVNPTLTINVSPSSPSVCLGDSVSITASGANNFLWSPATGLSSTSGSTILVSPIVNTTYTVVGTNNTGCFNDTTFVVTVNPKPVINTNASASLICAGQSVTINASGANNYTWTPATALNTTLGPSVIANPTTTTSYIVQGSYNTGCYNTDTVTINVNPLPNIAINPALASICSGDSVVLNASGGCSYLWSPSAGLNSTNTSSVIANPISTTNYTVIGTDNNGCTDSSLVTVTVNPIPVVSVSPASTSICFGNSVNLSASGATNYSWTPATGLSSTTGANVIASPASTTTYTVLGANTNGCFDEFDVVVTVNLLPVLNINASSTTICSGQSVTLSASGAISYTWSPSTALSSTTGATVTATPSTTTTYYLTGTNSQGCISTDSVTITVNQVLTISVNPSSPSICIGDTVLLTALGANIYSWTPINGLSSTTGQSVSAFSNSTTMFTVTGTDINGCVNSADVTVTVNPLPIININSSSQNICFGDSVNISASGTTNYLWSPASGLNTTIGSNIIASPTSTTNYTVIGTDGNGCSNTANTSINVNPLPTLVTSSSPSAICFGDTSTLGVTGATNYSWFPSNGLNSITETSVLASPSTTSMYLITGTDNNGCINTDSILLTVNPLPIVSVNPASSSICFGDSVNITVSGANSYLWSPSSGLSSTTATTVLASPVTNSTYSVVGTDNNGCINSTIAIIDINPLPQISFTHDSVACVNSTVSFNNSSMGANSFWWDFGDGNSSTQNTPTHNYSNSGFYTLKLIGQSPSGCIDSSFSVIQIVTSPTANYTISPDTGCGPLYVSFNNLSSGYNVNYNWNFGNGTSSNLQNPLQVVFNQGFYADTNYVVSLTSSNMCGANTYSDTVVVKPKPVTNFGLSSNYGCSPFTISFSNITTGLPNSYYWDFGDGTTSSATLPAPHTFIAGANDSIYTITLISYNYCGSDTLQKQITVRPQSVNALFNPSVYFGCAPLSVTFNNFSTLNSNFSWDFDDGNFSTAYSPTHIYSTPGTYHVLLVVSDTCSIDTTFATITVSPFPTLNYTISNDSVCVGEVISFNNLSSNLSNIIWKFGDGNSSNIVNPSHAYSASGIYEVTLIGTAQSTACVDSLIKYVLVKTTPNSSFNPSVSDGCFPLPVSFQNTSSNSVYYLWDFGDGNSSTLLNPNHTYDSSGVYNVQLISYFSNGCSDTNNLNIEAYPKPHASFTSSSLSNCDYPATINLTNQSIGASGYSWDLGNGQTSTLNNPSATYNSTGIFPIQLIASNQYNCTDTSTLDYSVYEKPDANFSVKANTGCEPFGVEFIDASKYALNFYWDFGDGTTSIVQNPSHTYNQNGKYSIMLIVIGDGGCSDTIYLIDEITVNPNPVVDFSFINTNIPKPNSGAIQFTNLTTIANSYLWDLGDGDMSTEENPNHRYNMHGYYTVNLTANNQFNCSASLSKEIMVDQIKGLYIPNAFSPNNPVAEVREFIPKGKGLKEYHIVVYDTWGNLLWESNKLIDGQPSEKWNGEYKGKPLQQDVYIWKADAIFEDNSIWQGMDDGNGTLHRYGTVSIIR